MGKSELRNVEPADERAVAANKEFEILSFFLVCFSEGFLFLTRSWCMRKYFSSFTENDSEINLITKFFAVAGENRVAEAAATDVGHHETSGRFWRDNCVILVIFVVSSSHSVLWMLSVYPHVASHKAWEMNNKKSISNYALMFLSLYTWTLLSFYML